MEKSVLMTLYGPLESDARVLRSIESFKDKNYKVTILTVGTSKNYVPSRNIKIVNKNYAVHGFLKYIYFSLFECYYTFVNRHNFNLIYMHDYYSCLPGCLISCFFKKNIFYDAHELLLKRKIDKVTFRDKFFIFFERKFTKRTKFIIEANKERECLFRRFYRLNNVSNVMNITKFHKNITKSRNIKREVVLVYQGAISENRNLSFYIKALKELPSTIRLTLIGDGKDLENYKNLAKEINVSDRVLFTGRLSNDEMMNCLERCHIGIVSYSFNTLNDIYCSPNKIFEYAAISLPFISTPQPFIKEVSKRYAIGKTYTPNDISSFIVNLNEIIEKYDYYQQGLDKFLNDYNYEVEKEKLKNLIP